MATASGYASPPAFSPSSSLSLSRSPDTTSTLYPERVIRPLPRSRLKSKLSPEQASAIAYPPNPPPVSPTLSFRGEAENATGGNRQRRMTNGDGVRSGYVHSHRQHHHHDTLVHDHCTCGEEADSGDEEVEFDHPDYRYLPDQYRHSTNGVGANKVLDNVQRRLMEAARIPAKPPPPGSTASSADGYESFENTSNKKKRKIPLSAASGMHQSQLSAEMASMGISGGSMDGSVDDVHGGGGGGVAVQSHHAPPPAAASSGTGISGAGRGRYGRQSGRSDHGIRRPLASSSMSAVNGSSSRLPANGGSEARNGIDVGLENTNTGGIISQAIKTAAEQGPLTPQRGQENASLLQSATSTASTPASAKTQFTFAVESESANKMVDQQAAVAAAQASYPSNARGPNGQAVPAGGGKYVSTQGTQTTPSLRASNTDGPTTRAAPSNSSAPSDQQQAQPPPKPKPRRRPSKEYALAARQRRLQQEYANYHHRPTKENMWICEFCEYEDIFGVPPVALIRQYEIKDRQERKRAAEKRRLLEKAKAKNRKGKKGGKKGNNAASAHNNSSTAASTAAAGGAGGQAYDPNLPPPEGDEYYDDEEEEYGDEYEPVGGPGQDDQYHPAGYYPPPPPAPAVTPQTVGSRGKQHPG